MERSGIREVSGTIEPFPGFRGPSSRLRGSQVPARPRIILRPLDVTFQEFFQMGVCCAGRGIHYLGSVAARAHSRPDRISCRLNLQVVDEIPKTASEKPQERFLLEAFDADADNVFTER